MLLDQTGIDGEVTAMTAGVIAFQNCQGKVDQYIAAGGVACLFRKHEFRVDSGFKGAQQAAKLREEWW
jgi:hypothetical protein